MSLMIDFMSLAERATSRSSGELQEHGGKEVNGREGPNPKFILRSHKKELLRTSSRDGKMFTRGERADLNPKGGRG